MNPDILRTVLGNVTYHKMRRAWRNRSNCTHWLWVNFASQIQGKHSKYDRDTWQLAACLYVACGWYAAYSGSETFDGATIPPRGWALIGLLIEDFLVDLPDRALTRSDWKKQSKREAKERCELCKQHKREAREHKRKDMCFPLTVGMCHENMAEIENADGVVICKIKPALFMGRPSAATIASSLVDAYNYKREAKECQ